MLSINFSTMVKIVVSDKENNVYIIYHAKYKGASTEPWGMLLGIVTM